MCASSASQASRSPVSLPPNACRENRLVVVMFWAPRFVIVSTVCTIDGGVSTNNRQPRTIYFLGHDLRVIPLDKLEAVQALSGPADPEEIAAVTEREARLGIPRLRSGVHGFSDDLDVQLERFGFVFEPHDGRSLEIVARLLCHCGQAALDVLVVGLSDLAAGVRLEGAQRGDSEHVVEHDGARERLEVRGHLRVARDALRPVLRAWRDVLRRRFVLDDDRIAEEIEPNRVDLAHEGHPRRGQLHGEWDGSADFTQLRLDPASVIPADHGVLDRFEAERRNRISGPPSAQPRVDPRSSRLRRGTRPRAVVEVAVLPLARATLVAADFAVGEDHLAGSNPMALAIFAPLRFAMLRFAP